MKLTPKDIENPARASGYNYVHYAPHNALNKYRAEKGVGGTTKVTPWQGPRRATALEAAQDYCDYINGRAPTPALKSAGHAYVMPRRVMDEEERAAWGVIKDRQAQRSGKQGYVYCIGQIEIGGGISAVKIGYSVNPAKRVAELQTGNPRLLKLLCMRKGSERVEKRLHQKYVARNILQEWFAPTKEMLLEFSLDPEGNPYPNPAPVAQKSKEAA